MTELEKYQPFTSKDCDLWVSMTAFEHFQSKTDGKLKKGTSPADGQLAVFTTHDDPPLKIDLMSGVFGIPPVDERRIRKRLLRIESGNLGDYKSIGEGVFELRFFFGSGYRIYFGFSGETVVLLLCGGDKSSQTKNIEKAKIIWKDAQND